METESGGDQMYAPTHAQALMKQPLWLKSASPDTLPHWAKSQFQTFNESKLAQTTSFGLITEWYRSLLRGQPSLFGEAADIAIAQMDPKLWGDGDKDFDAIEVMDRVAEIAGWRRPVKKTPRWDFFLSYSESDLNSAREISNILEDEGFTVFSQFNDMAGGNSFIGEMNRGLAGMSRFIAIYSEDYFSSEPCQSEWEAAYLTDAAAEKGKLLPFLVAECTPTPLAKRIIWCPLIGLDVGAKKKAVVDFVKGKQSPKSKVEQRRILKTSISPDIGFDKTGSKLDIQANPVFDTPFVDVPLLELPEYLKTQIDLAISALKGKNCPSGFQTALNQYRSEIDARGVNCKIGILRGQMDFIEAEVESTDAEFWCSSAGLKKTISNIRDGHTKLITNYPLDQTREALIRAIDIEDKKLDANEFEQLESGFMQAVNDAKTDDVATSEYASGMKIQVSTTRDILNVQTPAAPISDDPEFVIKENDRILRVKDAKKRAISQTVGMADKSLDILNRGLKVAESDATKALATSLKRLVDWFW